MGAGYYPPGPGYGPGAFPPGGPPVYGPPPMLPPWMLPPPPRRSTGGRLLRTLLGIILVASLAANLYLLAFSDLLSSAAEEQAVQSGSSKQRVVVLPVEGVLVDSKAEIFRNWMKSLKRDSRVKALVLAIDTPGGTVTASDDIRRAVVEYKQDHPTVPVVVTMGSMAASGGYYVATAADYIFACPTSLTGSIGVRMDMYNVSELAQRWGVAENSITAPVDGLKNAGSMFKPLDSRERAYFQAIVDDAYDRFKDLVATARKGRLRQKIEDVCNAGLYTAGQAHKNGLIDQIGYPEEAYAWAAQKAGLTSPTIVRYRQRPTLLDALLGENAARSGPIGGVQINIDRGLLEDLRQPRLMYLWRPE
jgi:protease-4